MSTETELKLVLAPDALRQLRKNALVMRHRRGPAVTDQLKSVYFDTEDLDLRDHAMALRVRHIGRKRIQTLKTLGNAQAGIARRQEWEAEIEGDTPEARPLKAAAPELPIPGERLVRNLHPVFSTEIKRTRLMLGADGWEVELALDEGRLVAPHGEAPIVEAELELKRGEPRILFDIAREMQRDVNARVSVTSKAERGYAMLAGAGLLPRRARSPLFPQGANVETAFRCIARTCAEQMLANQDVVLATRDPEAIHQMRVALRRLSSAMRLFQEPIATPEMQAVRNEIRWLQSFLGPARDAEVFVSEIINPLVEDLSGEPGFRTLRRDFVAQRRKALDAAIEVLAQPRFVSLTIGIGAWIEGGDWRNAADTARRSVLDGPADAYAVAMLDDLDRRVKRSLKRLARFDAEQRHRARIRVKRLRYAAEFFSGLFPGAKPKRLVEALGRVQDRLGRLNDIAVAARLLRDHAERKGDPARLWAAGKIAGWHAAQVHDLLAAAEDGRHALERISRFWHPDD